MSLLNLPEIRAEHALSKAQFDTRQDAMERWHPEFRAAAEDDNTISIYDPIGERWDGNGVTVKRISAALRSIGSKDVVVNINSPGGNFFEGVSIYNALREHKGKVTVQVMGLAASAASVIAMAGDEIKMGDGTFLMIHNAWAVAVGNRHDFQSVVETLEPFDAAMAQVYAARSGLEVSAIVAMMDKETWIGAHKAIEDGFATGLLDSAQVKKDASASTETRALALVEASMAQAGYTRSERRDVLKNLFSSKPGAAGSSTTPSAGNKPFADDLRTLLNTIQGN